MTAERTPVTPGTRLGSACDLVPGPGTYVRDAHVYASVLGYKLLKDLGDEDGDQAMGQNQQLACVTRERELSVVPVSGSIVICRVMRVNPRFASVKVLCADNRVLQEDFGGMIRQQDVRATEVDGPVEIYKSFRPGDIVRAEVLSLGDSRSYYLTTGKNELGVIYARSVAGFGMVPVSWEYMECPKTRAKEPRKVARPSS